MNRQFGWLVGRREAIALGVAGIISALGWLGTTVRWPLLLLAHEPGLELALFLNLAQQEIGFLTSNEPVVFALNLLVWTGVLLVAGRFGRSLSTAWKRSLISWSFLLALGISALGELTSYDNYWVPLLPTLANPGWAIATLLVPIRSFVIDMRTPLGLFFYPDRLITTALAFVINAAFWTTVLYVATLGAGWFQRWRSRTAAA